MQLFKDLTADTENMAENKGQTKQRFAIGLVWPESGQKQIYLFFDAFIKAYLFVKFLI